VEHGGSKQSNSGELPRLWQAGSRASTNTHTGVLYVWTVRRREQGRSLHRCAVKMRMEEWERETGTRIVSSDCLSNKYTVLLKYTDTLCLHASRTEHKYS
jgi:hypothetical protein